MGVKTPSAFAVWITGLPASGKSTVTASVAAQLREKGVDVAVLESDALRPIFVRQPRYDEEERNYFYCQMVYVGVLLTQHGVPVIFDATANRRSYRELARQQIPHFLEVYVATPLEVCIARDPKGIYRQAREGGANSVPGLQAVYEPPEHPDLILHTEREEPERATARVIAKLVEKGYLKIR